MWIVVSGSGGMTKWWGRRFQCVDHVVLGDVDGYRRDWSNHQACCGSSLWMKVLKTRQMSLREEGHDIGMRDLHLLGMSYVTADGTRVTKNKTVSQKGVISVPEDIFYRRLDTNARRSAGIR